jgi:hypothetical protein
MEEMMGVDKGLGQGRSRSATQTWLLQRTEHVALLVMCMYLVTLTDSDMGSDGNMFSPMYRATKLAYATLSCLSMPTVELIQSGALIALFEFGHGRARAAYRTLSGTRAMAQTSGVKPGVYLHGIQSVASRIEEEKQALWWGIFILDQ